MGGKFIAYFIISVLLILSLVPKISLAQQVPFSPRENAIFTTLNQLQEKDDVMKEAMKEAQMNLLESRGVPKKLKVREKIASQKDRRVGAFSFRDLVDKSHPYLKLDTTSDDNINKNKEQKGSIINTVTPGLKKNFFGKGKSLNLDMSLENIFYNNRNRKNSLAGQVSALSNFNLGRYILSVSDDYYNSYLSKSAIVDVQDKSDYYWKNDFSTNIGRYFNRIGFNLGYERINYEFENDLESQEKDRAEDIYTFTQNLRLATKTQLIFDYAHIRKKYKYSNDKTGNDDDFSLGFSGVISPKISAIGKITYKILDYKVSDDLVKTSLAGKLSYQATERTNYSLDYTHAIHKPIIYEDYYIENDFIFSGNHRLAFNPKLQLSFSFEADIRDYSRRSVEDGKKDNDYDLALELSYAFRRWIDFELDYSYHFKDSKVTDTYHRNLVSFKTEMRF
jgi:hypothetical protein